VRILIVDDERPARERLADQLREIQRCEIAGEAASGREALTLCERLRPDVALLDIRMPGMDGIETARHMSRLANPPAVIFTTAYDEYAIEAFEAEAVGYLLKPIRRGKLEQALERAARLSGGQIAGIAAALVPWPLNLRPFISSILRTGLSLVWIRPGPWACRYITWVSFSSSGLNLL